MIGPNIAAELERRRAVPELFDRIREQSWQVRTEAAAPTLVALGQVLEVVDDPADVLEAVDCAAGEVL